MTLRSVLTIDVDDERFKKFKEAFDKYQEQLKAMPESWKAAAAEQDVLAQGAQKAADALIAYDDVSGRLTREMEAQDKHLARQSGSWRSIARDTREASSNVTTMTRSFLKWSGLGNLVGGAGRILTGLAGGTVLTGLLGGAAAYGMKVIADTVGDYRRSALGLGTTIGQERAFGLDLGRFITPQQFLGAAAQGIYDIRSPAYRGLLSAGVSPQLIQGGNATQVSEALLARLPQMFAGRPFGTWQSILDATGLSAYMSPMDVRRILSTPREYQKLLESSGNDQGPLGIGDRTAKTWQDLSRNVELAEGSILTTFVKGAAPVAASFSALAGGATQAASALDKLAAAVTGKPSAKGGGGFDWMTAATAAAAALVGGRVAGLPGAVAGAGLVLASPQNKANPSSLSNAGWLAQQRAEGKATWYGQLWSALTVNKPLVPNGNAMDDLLGLVRQDETRGRKGMEHAVSSAGAIGLYQIMPGTALQYGRDPSRLQDIKYNTDTARIILAHLVKQYHGNLEKVLLAYHSGPGAVDHPWKVGPAGREYLSYAHKQNTFRQVQVEISKATGADVIVSTQQIPTWLNSAVAFAPGQ